MPAPNQTATFRPEAWLRGPVEGVPDLLQPAAHALVQVGEEVESLTSNVKPSELWVRPGGAASPGFHLQHLAGSLDRLLTYARGEKLNEAQRAALAGEGEAGSPPVTPQALVDAVRAAIDRALTQYRETPPSTLTDARTVGRAALPTTVIGLLFHAAEHAQRHAGQLTTTLKIVRGYNNASTRGGGR